MVKSKTPEEFFGSHVGSKVWRKGKMLASELGRQLVNIPDGIHKLTLKTAFMDTSKRGCALQVLIFGDGTEPEKKIIKATALHEAESLATALYDLATLGFDIGAPSDLVEAYEKIEQEQISCDVKIETVNGARRISLMNRYFNVEKMETDVPAKVIPELKDLMEEPSVVEAPSEPEPEPYIPPQEPENEVNIRPGQRLVVKILGEHHEVTILRLYEEEREIAVQLADGAKHLISADTDVVKLLG